MLRSSPSVCRDPKQSGQIAVVILLVVAVMATLGLSQISQTTEDLFISSQREEATRVFNAAESGVEEALSDEENFNTGPITIDELQHADSVVNVDITPETGLRTTVAQGETATVDVTSLSNNNINIYWSSNASQCNAASLMLAIYTEDGSGNANTRYQFVRPYNCLDPANQRDNDQFTNSVSGSSQGYNYLYTLTGIGQWDRLIRITPLYSGTDLLVLGVGVGLSTQSHLVRSTAQTKVPDDADRTIEQIIQVQRSLPAAPSYMNYVLYTNGAIQTATN